MTFAINKRLTLKRRKTNILKKHWKCGSSVREWSMHTHANFLDIHNNQGPDDVTIIDERGQGKGVGAGRVRLLRLYANEGAYHGPQTNYQWHHGKEECPSRKYLTNNGPTRGYAPWALRLISQQEKVYITMNMYRTGRAMGAPRTPVHLHFKLMFIEIHSGSQHCERVWHDMNSARRKTRNQNSSIQSRNLTFQLYQLINVKCAETFCLLKRSWLKIPLDRRSSIVCLREGPQFTGTLALFRTSHLTHHFLPSVIAHVSCFFPTLMDINRTTHDNFISAWGKHLAAQLCTGNLLSLYNTVLIYQARARGSTE